MSRELEVFFKKINEQYDFLIKNLKNPELARPDVIESISLEFILSAINYLSNSIDKSSLINENIKKEIETLRIKYPELVLRRLDVHYYMTQLGTGWKCDECQYSIPRDAEIHGVRRPPITIFLICKVCGKKKEITQEGYKEFDNIFGKLIIDEYGRWNPLANRFLWKND